MNPEDFKNKMQEIADKHGNDPEEAHQQMDRLIYDVLSSLGYTEGATIFNNQVKYYT